MGKTVSVDVAADPTVSVKLAKLIITHLLNVIMTANVEAPQGTALAETITMKVTVTESNYLVRLINASYLFEKIGVKIKRICVVTSIDPEGFIYFDNLLTAETVLNHALPFPFYDFI